jgi:hypothetical protein
MDEYEEESEAEYNEAIEDEVEDEGTNLNEKSSES